MLLFLFLNLTTQFLMKHGNARAPAGHICKENSWKRAPKCKYHSGSNIKIPLPQIYAFIKFYLSSLMLQKQSACDRQKKKSLLFLLPKPVFREMKKYSDGRWIVFYWMHIDRAATSTLFNILPSLHLLFQLQSCLNLKMETGRRSDLLTPDFLISLL